MRRRRLWFAFATAVVLLFSGALFTRGMGFTSRAAPGRLEEWAMRTARAWATPSAVRHQVNPIAASPDVLQDAMEHWADHCALCHGNDGSGRTGPVKGFYPPTPDMRRAPTQEMTDGELFYVIEHGVPLTGMPAWGNGTPDGERQTWALVRFIRHLPQLTEAEVSHMEKLNPSSPMQLDREQKINDFLKGS